MIQFDSTPWVLCDMILILKTMRPHLLLTIIFLLETIEILYGWCNLDSGNKIDQLH